MKKCQISLEYMLVFGMVFALVVAAFSGTWFYYKESKNANDAEEAVAILANTADTIYALGNGSMTNVVVNLPYNAQVSAGKNEIVFIISETKSSKIYNAYTKGPVMIGILPSRSGRFQISVQKLSNGTVKIGD